MTKELGIDIKSEMWANTIGFLIPLQPQSIADVCWQYNDDGAITSIEIKFESPLYMTTPPLEKKNIERRYKTA